MTVRERGPEELPLDLEVWNASHPEEWRRTVEQAQAREALERPEDRVLRLIAFLGHEAAGVGVTSLDQLAGVFRFLVQVAVRPELRRRGIGRALYDRLVEHARKAGGQELVATVLSTELERIEGWLEREGYQEVNRARPSELTLANLDEELLQGAEERVAAQGISLVALTEDDTDENRRKLWELHNLTVRDVPLDSPALEHPFERFQEWLDAPMCRRDCTVIAKRGEELVGFTILNGATLERAGTAMTGVHPAYRGRGIALAVKARSARLARDAGFRAMRTTNHLGNAPMLAVNRRLGYQPLPEIIVMVKRL
jgi:GNAT superfamily N-acetyltransferase